MIFRRCVNDIILGMTPPDKGSISVTKSVIGQPITGCSEVMVSMILYN